jgi:four helix bundle protein
VKNIENYKDLQAWQAARKLARLSYDLTAAFPSREQYALQQQIRRSAVSVAFNIAEGYGRGSRDDYMRFLKIARGSLYELETQFIIAADLEYITAEQGREFRTQFDSAISLLQGLLRSVGRSR